MSSDKESGIWSFPFLAFDDGKKKGERKGVYIKHLYSFSRVSCDEFSSVSSCDDSHRCSAFSRFFVIISQIIFLTPSNWRGRINGVNFVQPAGALCYKAFFCVAASINGIQWNVDGNTFVECFTVGFVGG